MALTFVDLYGEQLDKQLSSSDRLNLFTTAKRKTEINQAAQWFATQTECVVRETTTSLSDNTTLINLATLVSDEGFLAIAKRGPEIRITRTVDSALTVLAGRDLPRTTVEVLNRDNPGWRSETKGTPRCHYIFRDGSDYKLGVAPPLALQSGYTAILVVPYLARPVDMVDDTDVPFTAYDGGDDLTLTPWYDALVYKAASQLELLRKDLNRSMQLEQLAQARVLDYLDKQRVPGGRSVQMQRVRSRSRWQAQRAVRETVMT